MVAYLWKLKSGNGYSLIHIDAFLPVCPFNTKIFDCHVQERERDIYIYHKPDIYISSMFNHHEDIWILLAPDIHPSSSASTPPGWFHKRNVDKWPFEHFFKSSVAIWLVVSTPLKNISQLGSLFPIYGKIKNVLNRQPAIDVFSRIFSRIRTPFYLAALVLPCCVFAGASSVRHSFHWYTNSLGPKSWLMRTWWLPSMPKEMIPTNHY